MANPRSGVAFDEIDVTYVTFFADGATIVFDPTKAGGSAQAGQQLAVTMISNSTVALAADADRVIGQLARVEPDNKAVVAVEGFLKFKGGSAAALTLGASVVGALNGGNKGYVRAAVAAEAPKAGGEIVDAADTTNVVVYLS